jgi:proliferating cell nuclear antigen
MCVKLILLQQLGAQMLKGTINADTFRDSIDAVAALVTECRLHFSEQEVWIRSVDTANVAMVILTLQRAAFNTFEATDGELGLDITKMKNIFTMMGKASEVSLEYPDGSNKIEVRFEGYHYAITLLDTNTIKKDPNAPGIELPGTVTISGTDLYNTIKSASVVSDKMWLGINAEKKVFFIKAEGDSDHIEREFTSSELISCNFAEARSLFSVDYLKDMGKVMAHAANVTIHLGADHPVKFSFDIAGGNGHVEYLLAPRIEAD